MADERDPQISRRYRELGTEEPPPALDRAILGAARRATTRHRWYSSLAAAAVLIFAVAIVVQIERRPPEQVPMSAPSAPVGEQAAPQDRAAPAAPPAKPAQRRRAPPDVPFAPEPPARAESVPPAPAPAPEPNANAEPKRADEMRAAPRAQGSMAARRSAAADAQSNLVETPQQWLARIAHMRQLGLDDEAEKELAQFRKRYPDYRIPDAMAKEMEKQAPGTPANK